MKLTAVLIAICLKQSTLYDEEALTYAILLLAPFVIRIDPFWYEPSSDACC